MYFGMIILLMAVLPVGSILIELAFFHGAADVILLIGKWFTFWAIGVRLILAGSRQLANPAFTAISIFGAGEKAAEYLVQEIGFGNLSMGLLGLLSLVRNDWIVPAVIAGGLYYGLAGLKHAMKPTRSDKETIAMVSDIAIFVVLAGFLAATAWG